MDWIRDNVAVIVAVIVALLVVRPVVRRLLAGGGGRRAVMVFCSHCNWEGEVSRKAWACRKCRSTDLRVKAN